MGRLVMGVWLRLLDADGLNWCLAGEGQGTLWSGLDDESGDCCGSLVRQAGRGDVGLQVRKT
jgi:hypothetical protein